MGLCGLAGPVYGQQFWPVHQFLEVGPEFSIWTSQTRILYMHMLIRFMQNLALPFFNRWWYKNFWPTTGCTYALIWYFFLFQHQQQIATNPFFIFTSPWQLPIKRATTTLPVRITPKESPNTAEKTKLSLTFTQATTMTTLTRWLAGWLAFVARACLKICGTSHIHF